MIDRYEELRDLEGRITAFGTPRNWTVIDWKAWEQALSSIDSGVVFKFNHDFRSDDQNTECENCRQTLRDADIFCKGGDGEETEETLA